MAETYEELLRRLKALGVQAPTQQQVINASKFITSPGNLTQPTSGVGSTAETNRLLGGQYFNEQTGSQIKPFTTADAQANTANYSSTIPAATMQPQTQMTIPDATPTTNADVITAGAEQTSKQITTAQSADEAKLSEGRDELGKLYEGLLGEGKSQLDAEQDNNVPGLKQELTNVNNQITTRLAEFKKLQDEYAKATQYTEGKAIPMNLIIGQNAERNRALALEKNSMASDIGLLQAQASALQGNLQEAQRMADRAVDLKYEDAKTLIEVKTAQLKLLEGKLDREESKTADALALQYQQQKDALAVQVANEKDINNTILNLLQANPGAGISLSDSVEVAAQKVASYQQANGGTDNALMEISPGASLYDPTTGKFVATAPKSYAPTNKTNTPSVKFTATEQKNYEAFKSEINNYSTSKQALDDLASNKTAIIQKIGQAGYDLLVKDIEAHFGGNTTTTPYGEKEPLDLQKATSSGGLSFESDISNFLFQ